MLNKKKPYDMVYGVPGVTYVQNGVSYNAHFEEVGIRHIKVEGGEMEVSDDTDIEEVPEALPNQDEEPENLEVPKDILTPPPPKLYVTRMTKEEIVKELKEDYDIDVDPEAMTREELRNKLREARGGEVDPS